MNDIVAALAPVTEILEQMGVRYFIGGSVASSFHGAMRSTMDVDVVADLDAQHVTPLVASLGDSYYASESAISDAVRRRAAFNLIHLDTSFKVDVFVSRQRPFDEASFQRAAVGPLGDAYSVPIASVEDIIISKLEWYRVGGEVSERQWNDVLTLAKLLGPSLDTDYLISASREVDVEDLLQQLLREGAA